MTPDKREILFILLDALKAALVELYEPSKYTYSVNKVSSYLDQENVVSGSNTISDDAVGDRVASSEPCDISNGGDNAPVVASSTATAVEPFSAVDAATDVSTAPLMPIAVLQGCSESLSSNSSHDARSPDPCCFPPTELAVRNADVMTGPDRVLAAVTGASRADNVEKTDITTTGVIDETAMTLDSPYSELDEASEKIPYDSPHTPIALSLYPPLSQSPLVMATPSPGSTPESVHSLPTVTTASPQASLQYSDSPREVEVLSIQDTVLATPRSSCAEVLWKFDTKAVMQYWNGDKISIPDSSNVRETATSPREELTVGTFLTGQRNRKRKYGWLDHGSEQGTSYKSRVKPCVGTSPMRDEEGPVVVENEAKAEVNEAAALNSRDSIENESDVRVLSKKVCFDFLDIRWYCICVFCVERVIVCHT